MGSGQNTAIRAIILSVAVGLLALSSFFLAWTNPTSGVSEFWGRPRNPTTMNQAVNLAESYLNSLGDANLAIDEIMEFEYNFYIVYYEKSTNMGAFEAIIDKASTGGIMGMMGGMMGMTGYGYVRPEQGPNMMWNTKYGMQRGMSRMGGMHIGNSFADASITKEQAMNRAQQYLDKYFLGAVVENVHPFYGYYTFHVMKESTIFGMLSVNSATGQVWYHSWHGVYVQALEL